MDEFKALNCVRLTVRALKIKRREKTRGSTKVDSLPPPPPRGSSKTGKYFSP